MPTGSAITSPIRIAIKPSSTVTGSLPSILSSTAKPPYSDSPRVPGETLEVGLIGNPVRGRQHSNRSVLHPDRHIQSQPTLERRTVNPPRYVDLHPSLQYVYDIAGDEADREKDQDAQDKQRGDDQQQPPDDVGGAGKIEAPGALRSARTSALLRTPLPGVVREAVASESHFFLQGTSIQRREKITAPA